MEITKVRIKLIDGSSGNGNDRLRAFVSITFDDSFVVHDLKIINGPKGLFVSMPDRKLADRCKCGCKNHLRASFCNQCGRKLDENRNLDSNGWVKLHSDIAHPINSGCREMIEGAVFQGFHEEIECSQQPDHVSSYYDKYDN